MRDVRVAGLAQLAPVVLLGDGVGPLDDGEVGLGVGRADGLENGFEDGVAAPAAPTEAARTRARIRAGVANGDVADALAVASERTSSLMN